MTAALRTLVPSMAAAVILGLSACTEQSPIIEPDDVVLAKPGACPGHPSCKDEVGEVALDITLRDGADRIRSDGAGTYSDGAAGVEAIIMENGNLSFDLGGSDRCVFLDFEAPSGATWGGTCEQTRTSSGAPDIDGGFTALAVGQSMTTRSQVYWAADDRNWFLRFGANCADGTGDAVPDNRVTITRTGEDSWTYAANDQDGVESNAYLCYSNMKGKPGLNFVAELRVPFGFTLVRQAS